MSFPKFCIDHPIFAAVLSILIAFAGCVALINLPVEQYPNLTPPEIQVSAVYNGASADTIANDVASPLEQQILGAEDMIYMYSQNSSTGKMTMEIYFALGSDPNMAQVNVQNLAYQALAQLPQEVQQEGLTITKQTPNILLVIALQSPDGRYDPVFTSNYASINVVNELDLLPGISTISIIGQRNYSMRVWLKPALMAQLGLSTNDVISCIQEQNKDFGIGQLGQAPNAHPVALTIPMTTKGRLSTPEEFGNIILRAHLDGSMVLLKDIATIDLGAQDYTVDGALNGTSTVLITVYQEYGANALEVAALIKQAMKRISQNFPEGLEYSIPYDTTLFVQDSIREVIYTILQAALLVVFVVFVFLQNPRATLIPVLALIISIMGGFMGMYLLGYSVNTLTLFGMVLAIGIVVDDAIVVVENVERNLQTFKLSPKEAAYKAMKEVFAPVVAIVCVLCSVFIPVGFLGGIAGQLYKQFAITIAISVFFSGLVAITLSPALSALILKPQKKLPKIAVWFNQGLARMTTGYIRVARWMIIHKICSLSLFGLILVSLAYFFHTTPKSLVPNEDQGYLIVLASLPDGASLDRSIAVSKQIEEIARRHPGVESVVSLTGFSLVESLDRTTIATNFIILRNWKERKDPSMHVRTILKDLTKEYYTTIEDAQILVANPPAIQGLGTLGGFEFWIENRGDRGETALREAVETFIEKAKQKEALGPLMTTAQFDNLQFYVHLDRYKARAMGVAVSDVFQALQTLLGSVYVNNFNKFGRVYQVIVQAEPIYREKLENLGDMYVRSSMGQMVPLNALISIEYTRGANLISRFNDYPAAEILGAPARGFTSGEAILAMQQLAKEALPADMSFGWSGQAYQELTTGSASATVLLAGLFVVFLILAALYEAWSLPLAILMAVPFGTLGAFISIWLLKMSNDIYFQIGLVTLIALSAKNAILIVEFALIKVKEGFPIIEAALEAAKLRFRAILMTSLTFIFGVLPLVFSSGAGAASRHSVGVGVLGGMLAATILTLLFVPLFFTLLCSKQKKEPYISASSDEVS